MSRDLMALDRWVLDHAELQALYLLEKGWATLEKLGDILKETNFNSGLWDTYAPAFGTTNDAAAEGLGARSGFSNPLHQLASHKDYPLIPAVGGWMAFNNFDDMAFRKDCRQPWPANDPITFQREDSSYIAPQDIRLNGGLADSDGLDLGSTIYRVSTPQKMAFIRTLKARITAIGLDQSGYSGHSFRRGAATAAAIAGYADFEIQLLGRRRSDTYKLYLDVPRNRVLSLSARLHVAAAPPAVS
ncbi:hypothetical protein B0H14DRAFT_3778456 [Mycena olivaceomarginata]|nr:hypothetical protein B0H14DRAFT_3778456 [Mycena olivaceomarginata]